MRVEMRLEDGGREWSVILECDKAVSPEGATLIARDTLAKLVDAPFKMPHQQ